MAQTTFTHRVYAKLRRLLPAVIADALRRVATAVLTPIRWSFTTGHFRSAMAKRAVKADGTPNNWYTFASTRFIEKQDLSALRVLEFGAGQSTLWWAHRCQHVRSLEGDAEWHAELTTRVPDNVALSLVDQCDAERCVADCTAALQGCNELFDVVVIDGLYRREIVPLALEHLAEDGVLICDNSEGYGFFEALHGSGMMRVDFDDYAPGVFLPHSTSLFFRTSSTWFSNSRPISTYGNPP